jgi:hypothetical protein
VGTYHGLPLDFLEDSYRHPRLASPTRLPPRPRACPNRTKPVS